MLCAELASCYGMLRALKRGYMLCVLSATQLCDIWDHAKRHFFMVNCNCKWQKSFVWKPRSWCHNVNETYWNAAEYRRHLFLSLDILYIRKSSHYHLSNNIKAWELKLLELCSQMASLSTHGYECHTAMVTGKMCCEAFIISVSWWGRSDCQKHIFMFENQWNQDLK